MTYSLTRFAIYETMRDYMTKDSQGPLPFYSKVLLGGISGEHWVVRARAGQRPRTQGTVTYWPWCLCHHRFNRRLRGDPSRFGQRQVCMNLLSPRVTGSLVPSRQALLRFLLNSAVHSAWGKSRRL